MAYTAKNPIRIVTAASLFDGHDASINIMRRVLQDMGAEVIHLGHNRSVQEVVRCALQEGVQGIAISSYQGGHMEYFKYMRDLLDQLGASYVKVFGGGGGVIIHEEKRELEAYGISQIFHPDDGRRLGIEGMIELILRECDFDVVEKAKQVKEPYSTKAKVEVPPSFYADRDLGLALSALENQQHPWDLASFQRPSSKKPPFILGVTGTGGAGKSSLVDELLQRFFNTFPDIKVGVICVDPTKKKTGGALLGDRIRMNALEREGAFMRSLASRGSGSEIAKSLPTILESIKKWDFDFVIAESSGIGQSSMAITEVSDFSLYVMTSEFGAQSQLEKIEMIDFAQFIAINKADHRGSDDAFRDVKKQYRRSHKLFSDQETPDGQLPVYLTQASNFNDHGVNELFKGLVGYLKGQDTSYPWSLDHFQSESRFKKRLIPAERQNYLAEITHEIRHYKQEVQEKSKKASQYFALQQTSELIPDFKSGQSLMEKLKKEFSPEEWKELIEYPQLKSAYEQKDFVYQVRGKEIRQPLTHKSLSGVDIPRVVVPDLTDWGDRFRFLKLENVPGKFPYTAGVFPLKRLGELPGRQFAGEGPPERTNKRFHYLTKDEKVVRLSTAFDSVTLYGQDPAPQPDIYGKVGESGVSIASLEDMIKLYEGFDLCAPTTSVSMTINGPAPMMLAFFMNTATHQKVAEEEKRLGHKLSEEEYQALRQQVMEQVRGTVQADILKEDQGQNTCIFSIDFALKMMADIQEYFTEHKIRNFYSVSISGYHIAEAGANPITQLAFTLSNAFTYVEYYLSRGLHIDDFAPNLSFFFSNGLDPEYTVLGRVARRIWAVALKYKYDANELSQRLKYHIQTSGRSLHAQEIDFNDIRTTLQALVALSDNCNSLHTNAYDEAITTPTEESVRRAQAIQLIINKEFGVIKNENPLQGSYFVEWLTETVEEAVLEEFLRINERGGVLGAMETQYQRGQIQEESMYYEHLKHSGELPIIGVNTFLDPKTLAEDYEPPKIEMARASQQEKQQQLNNLREYQKRNHDLAEKAMQNLKAVALSEGNTFEALLEASRYCSLAQMSQALYEVGGQYRRNL